MMLSRASAFRCTTFSGHVSHVVGLGAEKDMSRANARRVIAVMQSPRSGRDDTVRQSPCELLCRPGFAPCVGAAISIRCGASCPDPAFSDFGTMRRNWAVFVDTSPESLSYGHISEAVGPPAWFGTEAADAARQCILSCAGIFSAVATRRTGTAARRFSAIPGRIANNGAIDVTCASLDIGGAAIEEIAAIGAWQHVTSTMTRHRDRPLSGNRGACPGLLTQVRGA